MLYLCVRVENIFKTTNYIFYMAENIDFSTLTAYIRRMSGKNLYISEITGEQRRQLIDTRQVFEAYEMAREDFRAHYLGSMRWVDRNGADYLLRKHGKSEKSLGPRSTGTETAYRSFMSGRDACQDRLNRLSARMTHLAGVNMAMGIGRVPLLTARILRQLAEARLLGTHLFVVGTNALFAYEAATGAFVESGMLATGDVDLMMDARRHLGIAFDTVRKEGVIGLLRKVDKSFAARGGVDYRAVNRDGFFVDLIRPEDARIFRHRPRERIGDSDLDLYASPIDGLQWLINAPKFSAIAIDEKGFPLRIEAIDPRAFSLHKAWMSERKGRDPLKAGRDRAQAETAAYMSAHYLNLSFDGNALSALPSELRAKAQELLQGL